MTITRLLARPMLATIFVAGGVNALRNTEGHAAKARKITEKVVPVAQQAVPKAPIPTDPATLVRINAGAQILAASLVPTTLAGHAFWDETDPQAKAAQRLQFFKNTSLLGGLLLAAVDTDGRPGLAWRARRAAADVRREARQVAKDARREAKLARAQLT